jgi:hypothetical protein
LALAGLFDFEDFATFIGSALGAGVVGTLALVAVGALGEGGSADGVVGAAGGGAPFGVAALWVRHGLIPFAVPDPLASTSMAEAA